MGFAWLGRVLERSRVRFPGPWGAAVYVCVLALPLVGVHATRPWIREALEQEDRSAKGASRRVAALLRTFAHRDDAVRAIVPVGPNRLTLPRELTLPSAAEPQSLTPMVAGDALAALHRASETCDAVALLRESPLVLPNRDLLEKTRVWHAYACGALKTLPPRYFETPPYVHPGGGTFVARAWESGSAEFSDAAWREAHASFLHVKERAERGRLDADAAWLSTFDDGEVEAFLDGAPRVVGKHYVVVADDPDEDARASAQSPSVPLVRIFHRASWDAALANSPFTAIPIAANATDARGLAVGCAVREEALCWQWSEARDPSGTLTNTLLYGVLLSIAGGGAIAAYALAQRNATKREQAFLLHMLTHELRTPVTSLVLAADALEGEAAHLSDRGQRTMLILRGDISRLQRLVRNSSDYLVGGGSKAVLLPSLDDFVADLLERYGESVALEPLGPQDGAFRTDPHWLGVCVSNLVKNALTHGRPPVRVSLRRKGTRLEVRVSDGGTIDARVRRRWFRPFRKGGSSDGLGLGLFLVRRKARELGGDLACLAEPHTTFVLTIQETRTKETR